MSDEGVSQTPAVFSSKERAALVAKALSDAARRARFSTKKRRSLVGTGYRAKRNDRLFNLLAISSFVGIVVIPLFVSAIYLIFIASEQYTAEARFTVRGGLPSGNDGLGSLTGAPIAMIVQDTQIIINYIQSRAVVETLNKSVNLKRIYEDPDIDFFSRLKKNTSIEKTLAYWKRHVTTEVQMPAGIVVLTISAFSPDDAVKIADATLEASERLVNDMNKNMISDSLSLAQAERERAQANLSMARTNLEKARNEEGMLSADATSLTLTTVITEVKGQMIKMQQEYASQRQFVSAEAPQLKNLQSKIDAAKEEIAKLQAEMTQEKPSPGGNDKVLAGSMSRLDYAKLNDTIANSIYAGALAALEQAHIASELKLMYINTFVRPVPADQPKYPARLHDLGLIALASIAIWGAVFGVLKLFKSKLA